MCLLYFKVKNYIESHNRQPLIINGDSGSGKTSVIAKIANDVRHS